MKSLQRFTLFTLALAAFLLIPHSCTHDNDVVGDIVDPDFNYGEDLIAMTDGWNFDQNHSSVRWETLYLGTSALLTGRFNEFNVESFTFDEDDPTNISFEGVVILSTVNTGEPGRDEGCLQGTLGTEVVDEARLTSKSVQFDGEGGYIITADLDFHGNTGEVEINLRYIGSTLFDEDSGLHGAPFTVAGFTGEFEFNALTDYGIDSNNIADRVVVKCNLQFKKPG